MMKSALNFAALASFLFGTAFFTNVAGAIDQANHFLLSSRGCERATSGTGNKIITHQGKTHVTWLDSTEEGFFARVRTLDRASGQWSPTYTLGKANGNHGRPAMTMDSHGHLHVVYGIHHDTVPYKRSVRPNDASQWTEKKTFGGSMSYPTFVCGPDDTLYLSGRYGWEGVRMYAKPPGEDWEDRGLIIRTREDCFSYAAFHEGLVWGPDHRTLHLSCNFYESQTEQTNKWGSIQSANYMRSTDFGKTWQRADGTLIELPATSRTMDVLAAGDSTYPKPGIRNLGAIVVDSSGKPYVLYFHYNTRPPGQVFLVTPDQQGNWQHLPLQAAMEKYWPGWVAIDCRSGLTITEDDVICIAVKVIPREHPVAEKEKARWSSDAGYSTNAENARLSCESAKEWARENPKKCEIAWFESRDGGKTFIAKTILTHDPEIAYQQPSLEMPTGFNRIPTGSYPGLIYFTGLGRNAKANEVIDNDVYFVHVK
mgnify:CR=1 FL=1